MAYWYEKDPALYQFERNCYLNVMQNYKHKDFKVQFTFDNQKRFVVLVDVPFRFKNEPWRTFKFCIVYQHNHPGRGAIGTFGGSIRIYPLTKIKSGFHHMIYDRTMGLPYICQVQGVASNEVNGEGAMERLFRWIVVYSTWEKTGIDVDK